MLLSAHLLMANKKSSKQSKQSTGKPETKSPLERERRRARQKRVQTILQWVGYPSSGFGIAGIAHFIKNDESGKALLVALLTVSVIFIAIAAKFVSELFNSVLDKIEVKLEDKTETLATWIVNSLENWLLKIWWTITSNFKGQYYQQLEYSCRDYLTQGLDKDKILKLEKVFVPLGISTQDTNAVNCEIIQSIEDRATNSKNKQIWDFLAAMKDNFAFRRMVILGAPGSGKTTLLRYIALTYATNTQKKVHPQAPKLIPILLYLRDIREEITKNKPALGDLILREINKQRKIKPLTPPPNWFEDRLKKDKCLVLLDGLDEVADSKQRQQVRDWVDEQVVQYPDTAFILTSRPYGYQDAPLKQNVTALEVKPFSIEQTKDFLQRWYLQTEIMSRAGENDLGVQEEARQQAEELIDKIYNTKAIADMAVNPLLLTMIATVHRRGNILPRKRVELYREICQVLLEKRQRAKKIDDELTATQKQSVLQPLALALMANETREFQLSDLMFQSLIKYRLQKITRKISPQEFVRQIKDVCGLLIEKDLDRYEFAHLSLQEYLAAVEIKDSNQEEILINNLNDSWWHETIRLYIAQSDATNIIRAAFKSPTVESMALAYDCLKEAFSVNAEVRDELETQLNDDLESR